MTDRHCDTVASCEFESGYLDPSQKDNGAILVATTRKPTTSASSSLPCEYSSPTTVVRLNVMDRTKQGVRWTSDHFHPQLKQATAAATESAGGVGVGCCFQAMARESLFVTFSPTPHYAGQGKMWIAEFGSDGNTRTTLRHGSRIVRPLGRIATSERAWKDYWVCLLTSGGGKEKFLAGYGIVPGENCVAVLDAKGEHPSNSSTSQPSTEEEQRERPDESEPTPADGSLAPPSTRAVDTLFLGFGNGGGDIRSTGTPLSIRHIRFFPLPESWNERLLSATPTPLAGAAALNGGASDAASSDALLQEYQRECDKQRARARKFGLEYQEPPLTAFAAWSEARRLQLNPKEGFVTGIDLLSAEERAKQEARQRRFAGGGGGGGGESATSAANDVSPAAPGAEDITTTSPERTIVVEEAWDNDDKAHQFRIDPPRNLWKLSLNSETNDAEDDVLDEDNPATFAEEKIHMFSIDWAPFKQIRTNDIMAYFGLYGPSYVEWLGDLSCNILFQDKFSAARALHNLSIEIPISPSESVVAEGRPEGESSTAQQQPVVDVDDDLGRMGWRLGKTMLRKTTNDRFGRRGTCARVLLRVATSLDVLQERPTSWPKPPKWFTTGRVLMPKRHLPKRDNRERKRRSDPTSTEQWNPLSGDEHPLLSQGLASSRGKPTDSTKELERAAKRTKISE